MKIHKLKPEVLEKLHELVLPEFYEDYKLNVYSLAKSLGISLYEAVFEDSSISGYIQKIDSEREGFEIVVNKLHPSSRKRFTVAHELGHYISYLAGSSSVDFLKNKDDLITDSLVAFRSTDIPEDRKEMETEANDIAGELLMPKSKIEAMIIKQFSLEDMAMLFGVSTEAMSVRLMRLYPYNYGFLF